MRLDTDAVLAELDAVLSASRFLSFEGVDPPIQQTASAVMALQAALERFAPTGSAYVMNAQSVVAKYGSTVYVGQHLLGFVQSLRDAYAVVR